MHFSAMSEYNRDQWISFKAIQDVCASLPSSALEELREEIEPYLEYRRAVDSFQAQYFGPICAETCFTTGLSACCGFESIITFFADQVITFLCSEREEIEAMFRVLEQPNTTGKCVFLGENGCMWRVRCISCAMFLCDTSRRSVFDANPEAEPVWKAFLKKEKEFTWPTRPVLFDALEEHFILRGAQSPHMHFHRSPGLLRMKAKAGLQTTPVPTRAGD